MERELSTRGWSSIKTPHYSKCRGEHLTAEKDYGYQKTRKEQSQCKRTKTTERRRDRIRVKTLKRFWNFFFLLGGAHRFFSFSFSRARTCLKGKKAEYWQKRENSTWGRAWTWPKIAQVSLLSLLKYVRLREAIAGATQLPHYLYEKTQKEKSIIAIRQLGLVNNNSSEAEQTFSNIEIKGI